MTRSARNTSAGGMAIPSAFADLDESCLDAKRPCRGCDRRWNRPRVRTGAGNRRNQNDDTGGARQYFFQEFLLLGDERFELGREARDVPARPGERCGEAIGNRIRECRCNDRNRVACPPRGPHTRISRSDNDVHPELHQFCRQRIESLVLAVCPAVLDQNVLSFDPSMFPKPLTERAQPQRIDRRIGAVEIPDAVRLSPLLRLGRGRCEENAENERDRERMKDPLFHSITWSARRSIDCGIF